MNSDTLAKMRALRDAKKLGCSGAHKTDDGRWHPCASAESLREINPKRVSGVSPAIADKPRRRDQVGTAKIKKQWENLGQRGIVSIDTISGGGLVSGVIAKSASFALRDNDPDVFEDIESARARSRQLGCIGVSRRITASGRTVWMPCTNMTDLANRTGRTALGRRNMQRRTERTILDAVKKREKETQKRTRRKSLTEELHNLAPGMNVPYRVKAMGNSEMKQLGPQIGRGLRSAPSGMTFVDVTGAIDADKDGIVFEGKPLERPIIPKFILPDSVARRAQRLIQGTAEQNERTRRLSGNSALGEIDATQLSLIVGAQPESIESPQGDPLLDALRAVAARSSRSMVRAVNPGESVELLPPIDAGVEFSRQAKRVGKRRAVSSFDRIADVGDDYSDYSFSELAYLVEQATPTSQEELEQSLKTNPYTKKNWKRVLARIDAAKVDWQAQEQVRRTILDELRREPLLQQLMRRYGVPPIVATEFQPDIESLGLLNATMGPSIWGSTIGGWSGAGFIGINRHIINSDGSSAYKKALYSGVDAASTMRHELAHAWETMAARKGGPARERYIAQYQEIAEGLLGILERGEDEFNTTYHSAPWGTEAEHRSALKISEYAETARIEWFAESVAALTDPSPSKRASVDRLSVQNIAAVLGITPVDLVAMSNGRVDSTLGVNFSSRSQRTAVNRLLGKRNKEIDDAVSFLQENPQFIEDAPDEMLARLSPSQLNAALRDHARSVRSLRPPTDEVLASLDKADEARKNGELGQQVIDFLSGQATGKNASDEFPTLWFIGGTTGSGKSTLREGGVLEGVPKPNEAVDIDPDVIKSMHPDWNGGKGAQKVHKWSTQWTRYGLRQTMARQRDAVVTGTGVRTDQLSQAKQNGYLTVGHFVYVPVEQAVANMRRRAERGGTNLPDYFAGRYSSDLENKIPRAITSGLLDEFFLWDNSGKTPKLAARRTRDGEFEIFDRRAFEGFLGKRGASFVEEYWGRKKAEIREEAALNRGGSVRSSRSSASGPPARLMINGSPRVQGIMDSDLVNKDLAHMEVSDATFAPVVKLGQYDFFGAQFFKVRAKNITAQDPLRFESVEIKSSSFSGLSTPEGSRFAYAIITGSDFTNAQLPRADFSHVHFRGADFSNARLSGSRFEGARFYDVDFSGADLSDTSLTVEDVVGSGITWNADTKFPPEVDEYLKSAKTTILPNGKRRLFHKNVAGSNFDRSNGRYAQESRTKRSDFADLERGPRRALYDARAAGSDKFSVKDKELDSPDVSDSRLVDFAASNLKIRNGRLIRTDMSEAELLNVDMSGSDAERLFLRDAVLSDVSLANSDLRGSSFRGATVYGRLDLRNSDLRRASLAGLIAGAKGRRGYIDIRGADVRDADFRGIPIDSIVFGPTTRFDGADFSHIPYNILPDNIRDRVHHGPRSSRSSSRPEMMLSIDRVNDIAGTFSSMSGNDKADAKAELLGSYRSLFDNINTLNDIELDLAGLDVLRGKAAKSVDEYASLKLPDGTSLNLIDDIQSGNRSSFIDKFNSLRRANRQEYGNQSAIDAWSEALTRHSGIQSLDSEISSLQKERAQLQDALSLSNTLHLAANSDSNDLKPLLVTNNDLPEGKKTGPLGARSIRETRPLDSPEYIQSLGDRKVVKDVLDTFPDIAEDEESLAGRFAEFRYEFDSQLQELLSGKYDGIPAHPLAGSTLMDAINDTRIVVYSDGTNSLVAPPNKLLVGLLPDKRDWSSVELPDKDKVSQAKRLLQKRDADSDGGYSQDEITPMAQSVSEKIVDYLSEQLRTVDKQDRPAAFLKGMSPFMMEYLRVLNDPHDWLKGQEPTTISPQQASLMLHDGFGHAAIGRGFDRHGEWAVALAMLSLVRDNPLNLDDDERQVYAREVLARFGSIWLTKRLGQDSSFGPINDFMQSIYQYDGDIFDVIDVLDPRDVASTIASSSRSSRRDSSSILSPEKLREVSKIEARDRILRQLRNRRNSDVEAASPRKDRRSRRRQARSGSGLSSRSQRFLDVVAGEELQTPENARRVGELQNWLKLFAADLKNGSLYDVPIHQDLDSRRRELIDSITIEFDERGLPMVMADPHPIFSQLLVRDRDWRAIRLPEAEQLKQLNDLVRQSPDRVPRSRDEDEFASEDIDSQIYGLMESLLVDFFGEDYHDQPPASYPNAKPELGGLRGRALETFAGMWYGHLKYPLVSPLDSTQDVIHDMLGHIGTGRGFDRHGEWANAIAFLDFILYSPLIDASDEERNTFAQRWFRNYGLTHLDRSYYLEDTQFDDDRPVWTFTWRDSGQATLLVDKKDIDMKKLLDVVAPLDSSAASSRSSRSKKFSDASTAELRQIANDDVSAMNLRRSARSNTKSPTNKTPNTGLVKRPMLTTDSEGRLRIDGTSMSLAEIAGFDYKDIAADDLPANFYPGMPDPMRLLHARQELIRWGNRNVLTANDDGTLSASALNDQNLRHASTGIFKQDIVARLTSGQSLIVRDLPGDQHSGPTKMAVITRVGPDLVAVELDERQIEDIERGLKDLREGRGGPIGAHSALSGGFDGTEIFDVSQIMNLLPASDMGSVKASIDIVTDFQAQLVDVDGDIPRPSIMIRRDSYSGFVTLPDDVIAQYGGPEEVRKNIGGIAFAEDNSFTMYNAATRNLNPATMIHEWAHVADSHRGTNSALVSEGPQWRESAVLDAEFGQDLFSTDGGLKLAASEYRLRPPVVQAGAATQELSENLSPRIGRIGVSKYGETSAVEDFAEASKLFLLDKMYGYVLEETDFDGKPIPYPEGRRWTFRELYPNRARQLEALYFRDAARSDETISSRSSRKFDDRFKKSYGHRPPQGDGDCFVAANETVDRLTSSEFGIDRSQIRIVHGTPLGTGGEAEGLRFPHAWVEVATFDTAEHEKMRVEVDEIIREMNSDLPQELRKQKIDRLNFLRQSILENEMSITVYDFSNGNEAIVPAALYYAIGNIDRGATRYYNADEAEEMMDTFGHYGPWE